MSKIFILEDLTDQKILFEGSKQFIDEVLTYVGADKIPFFRDYEYEPEGRPRHILDAKSLGREIEVIISLINTENSQFILAGMSHNQLSSFFAELKYYCQTNPQHEISCYLFD